MKKLNITKKQYDESKYFNKKYGALKYMSESGKLYKTDKGVVLALEGQECKNGDCQENESLSDDADSEEVTRGELTDMLKDVVDAVEKVCDAQDCSFEEVIGVEPKDEAEEADDDEVVATKEEVAEVLADVIERVEDVAENAGIELPNEDDKEIEGECNATECGDKKVTLESLKKARRARLVREAIARRARAKKIHESILRNARLRKIRESISRRARAKKIHESILRNARRARLVREAIARRARAKKVQESIAKRRAMRSAK